MMRLFWYALMVAVAAAVVAGVSWVMAYSTVNGILGAPPPKMGRSSTTFLWEGIPRTGGHRAWRFAYGPTAIPGAPNVVFYVSPAGKLLRMEPADLAVRLKVMRSRGLI